MRSKDRTADGDGREGVASKAYGESASPWAYTAWQSRRSSGGRMGKPAEGWTTSDVAVGD